MNRDVYRLVLSFLPSVKDYCSLIRVSKFFYENRCKVEEYLEESSDKVNGHIGYFTKFKETDIRHGLYKRIIQPYGAEIQAMYDFGKLFYLKYFKRGKCVQKIVFNGEMAYPKVPDYGKTNPEPYRIKEKVWDMIMFRSITSLQCYVFCKNHCASCFFERASELSEAGKEFEEKYGMPIDLIENHASGYKLSVYDRKYGNYYQWSNHIKVPKEFIEYQAIFDNTTLYIKRGEKIDYIEHRDNDMKLHGLRKEYEGNKLLRVSVYWKNVLNGPNLEYNEKNEPILTYYKDGVNLGPFFKK